MHKHQVGHLQDGDLLVVKSGVLWKVSTGGFFSSGPTMLEQEQEQHIKTNT